MTVTLETELENYSLENEIGRGDLTIVYQARRKSDDALVAIKIVPPQFTFDETFVRRFKEAARQATKLEHPHIVRTYEAGQEDDVLYVVRELIPARSLVKVLEDEGPFPPDRMLTIAHQIASALDYAHQKLLIHGDLSAHRVYVGEDNHVTVADFGQTQAMAGTSLVKKGFAIGAPETTAPERVHGQSPSRQSDLYALGILSYQMLAGAPPFTGSPAAVLHAQVYEQPLALHLVNPEIPISLNETIERMLSKGSELRYITGAEFTRAMEMAVKGTAPMRAPAAAAAQIKASGLDQTPLWKRPWLWLLVALLIIGMLLIAGFGAVSLWSAWRPAAVGPTSAPVIIQATQPRTVEEQSAVVAVETSTMTPQPTDTPAIITAPTVAPTETPTPVPSPTPTLVPFPTPGPPIVAENSPFTNIILAHGISENSEPQRVGTSFAPGTDPLYLFFDYENIEPGTTWTHRWTWGDTELDSYGDVWPEVYSDSGTAWIFYNPAGGFEPGPYEVTLEIDGQVMVTATFVIEPGGL